MRVEVSERQTAKNTEGRQIASGLDVSAIETQLQKQKSFSASDVKESERRDSHCNVADNDHESNRDMRITENVLKATDC